MVGDVTWFCKQLSAILCPTSQTTDYCVPALGDGVTIWSHKNLVTDEKVGYMLDFCIE